MKKIVYFILSFFCVTFGWMPHNVSAKTAVPMMDLVDVQGIRSNQLVGYGLVVGLDGSGDRNQVKFTSQSITNMLRQFGVQIGDRIDPKLKNVASVSVTATVEAMAGPRSRAQCRCFIYWRCKKPAWRYFITDATERHRW